MLSFPSSVFICEVGPRDGLQMLEAFVPTDTKVSLVDRLSTTGMRQIQATAFVSPKAVSQFRDAQEVMSRITRHPDVAYTALVPNAIGARRALDSGVDGLDMVISVTESHSERNTGMSIRAALEQATQVQAIATEAGTASTIGLSVAFGCPFEGLPTQAQVSDMVRACQAMGYRRINLGDTIGVANPRLIYERVDDLRQRFPEVELSLHLHDTLGMGLANVIASLQAGIMHFDAAVAGLGGCPFAPGARGNIATEDLARMLQDLGVSIDASVPAVLDVARFAETHVGLAESSMLRAGLTAGWTPDRGSVPRGEYL